MATDNTPAPDPELAPLPVEPELPPPTVTLAAPPDVVLPPPEQYGRPPYTRLFLISFFILFFELVCIRWFGSTVVFLTFFTNIILIACFLGMSVGCLCAGRKTNFINWVLPLIALGCVLSLGLLRATQHPDLARHLFIDVGNQQNPANIYFGTEYGNKDLANVVIRIEAIAGVFFVIVALAFVGLGQEMGRAFDRIPKRVAAYTVNVLGSLLGIAFFSALSYAWTSPLIWFAIAALLMLYFLADWSRLQSLAMVVVLAVVAIASYTAGPGETVIWSPYYKVTYNAKARTIDTNNIAHQHMADLSQDTEVYPLIHALSRDAGFEKDPFRHVLIIGAGSGNDVQAALMHGVQSVDAVEIDPVISAIGKADHPNQPYDDPRLRYEITTPAGGQGIRPRVFITDGRQWLKRKLQQAAPQYDLVIYALVDSLVLHSSYSSLRLESFLFTEEAFRDVKANLQPGGVFAMYNFYRQPWVIARLNAMATEVFGSEPLVFSMPTQEVITDGPPKQPHITFLFVGLPEADGSPNKRLAAIRQKLGQSQSYWLATDSTVAQGINGYSTTRPAGPDRPGGDAGYFQFKPATVQVSDYKPLPTDDWPHLYLKDRRISPEVRNSMIVIGGLSLLILLAFIPKSRAVAVPDGRMFFLGAGFMLLETKGVVHMSLLFGSTWITNSVVFFAILVMILVANLFVTIVKPRKLWPYYLLLMAALAVNALVPMNRFLGLDGVWRIVGSCALIGVPVLFAGIIFAASFRDSKRPDAAFGWNIAGIILGALAENLSVMIGFNYLIFVAMGFYLLSLPFVRRAKSIDAPVPAPSP